MQKAMTIVGIGAIVLIAAFFVLNSYIYNEKQGDAPVEPYRGTLTGTYLCIPHKDSVGANDACEDGIRTDAGEQYAIDFNLMSQGAPDLTFGDRFSASGVITPIEMLSTDHWRGYDIVGIFSVTDSVKKEAWECNGDAKICPDGSSVGRTGPNCEFSACPPLDATEARVTTYLGGSPTALTVTVSPKEIVSDSRCPQGVQCIWAGTVEVRTVLATQVSHGEHVLKLNEAQIFGDYTVTLVEVTPAKTQEAIPESSYRFTFEIKKR